MAELPENRCPYCNRLLYYGYVAEISIKCPRCKHIIHYEILDLKQAIDEHRRSNLLQADK